jgi:flagellar protein FlaG
MTRTIRFSIDEELQDVVVKVVDNSSGEIVSQVPPEGVLRLRERIRDMAGLLIEKKV